MTTVAATESAGRPRRVRALSGLAAAFVLLAPAQALAATLNVNRTDDPATPTCTPSSCSLRGAITLADSDGGADTINIPAGTYQLTAVAGGPIAISASMTLAGAGARTTTILPASTQQAITISGGNVAFNGLTFANSTSSSNGGAVEAAGSTALTLNNDKFANNGVAGSNDGGAVEDSGSGQLTINASTFNGNKGYNGGALWATAPARIVNSTFVNNNAGNTSSNGDSGAMQLNTASTLINDTITGNECFNGSGCGGGIRTASVSVADTIIAGNLAYDSGTLATSTDNCSATITVTGPDLQDGSDCTGFTVHGNPQLGPLQNNGGPTDTMEPAANSPAVGAGTNASCATVDQRGGARPAPGGAQCDIGSVELNSLADTAIAGSASRTAVGAGGSVTYTLTATDSGPDPALQTTVQDVLPPGATLGGAASTIGSCSGTTTVTCSLGTLASGASATITISATLSQPGTATNVATVSAPATDPASTNNQATMAVTVVPAPTIAVASPANGARFAQGQLASASYSCAASSGATLSSCSGPVLSGKPINTATAGRFTFTVQATDSVGGHSSQTVSYTVVAPVLKSVRQSHSKWREGTKRATISRQNKKPPVGTTFRFTLGQRGRVKLSFSHRASGRRVKGKCVAPSTHNRHAKKCARTVSDGSLSFHASGRARKVSFDGVISRKKKLAPGTYTVTIVAINIYGKSSSPSSLRFTIVR